MDRLAEAYASARNLMVDGQVRPNRVYNPRLIAAMRRIPRERFVPAAMAARAYTDDDVPLGGGRYLTEPMVIARLIQLVAPRDGEHALVVASGSGYAAALLDACGAEVVALEQDPSLLALARGLLPGTAPDVAIVEGPLAAGWDKGGPYDIILIDGAVEEVPPAIVAQLRPAAAQGGGRLVTVLRAGGLCTGAMAEAVGGILRFNPAFDCATPILPAFRRAPSFVF